LRQKAGGNRIGGNAMVKETYLPVVAGVDGSEQSDRAVRFALAEARRRDVGVLLVHVVPVTAPMGADFRSSGWIISST
jgi:nucleotide-binding universal stress UspA family protein